MLSETALAGEYDRSLRCLVLIELAKPDYTAANVDALRGASDAWVAKADATRPTDLTDQEKLTLYTNVIDAVGASGGLTSVANRDEAIACAAEVGFELALPE